MLITTHAYHYSNENNFKLYKSKDGKKVKKQDGMSTITINYGDKVIRK